MEIWDVLKDNLENIRQKIEKAARKVKRNPEKITIIPITKNRKISVIKKLKELGFKVIGENRLPEIEGKYPYLKDDFSIHLVGKLQKKKIKVALKLIDAVHSLDDIEIAKTLEEELCKQEKTIKGFLEINIANEESKSGTSQEKIIDFLEASKKFKFLKVIGIMAMPPKTTDPEDSRKYFYQLRLLLEKLSKDYPDLKELSMGTSQDFEVAVEEGATILRLGEAIFKGV